jgi:hypothetical protein
MAMVNGQREEEEMNAKKRITSPEPGGSNDVCNTSNEPANANRSLRSL